ncbi:MAG: hypothetical protein HYX76_03435 [Acidobacteria bacterium]|nr:hypothetical protein [Acidobacteriota bacterium]
MSDSGEGLVDAEARLQERLDERAEERTRRDPAKPLDPERLRLRESLRLARAELRRQIALTEHPARLEQLTLAIAELDKRLAEA